MSFAMLRGVMRAQPLALTGTQEGVKVGQTWTNGAGKTVTVAVVAQANGNMADRNSKLPILDVGIRFRGGSCPFRRPGRPRRGKAMWSIGTFEPHWGSR